MSVDAFDKQISHFIPGDIATAQSLSGFDSSMLKSGALREYNFSCLRNWDNPEDLVCQNEKKTYQGNEIGMKRDGLSIPWFGLRNGINTSFKFLCLICRIVMKDKRGILFMWKKYSYMKYFARLRQLAQLCLVQLNVTPMMKTLLMIC